MTDLQEDYSEEPLNLMDRVQLISSQVNNSYVFWSLKRAVKEEIIKPKHKTIDLPDNLPRIFKEIGLEIQLKNKINEIYQELFSVDSTHPLSQALINDLDVSIPIPPMPQYFTEHHFEPLEQLNIARKDWSTHLKSKVMQLSRELDRPLVCLRQSTWIWAIPVQHTRLENLEDESEKVEIKREKSSGIISVYSHADFLNTLSKIKSPNYKSSSIEWGMIKVQLRTATIDVLRAVYEEMDTSYKQIGLDDDKQFIEERIALGEKLLQKDYLPYLIQYAKRGVPASLRPKIYSKILDIKITSKEIAYFEYLIEQSYKWEMVFDKIIQSDVYETCNDEKFFIFHEFLEKMMMCFMRDPWVSDNLRTLPNLAFSGFNDAGKPMGRIPPCGVIPFERISTYGAPFTYFSLKIEECYFNFRNFYCKYLCYLHSITSDERGILTLCRLFEDTLQTYDSELMYYLNSLNIHPLKIAFPWLFHSFVGFLEVEEVFLIWDRVIGYDSLEMIALVAAALFIYRGDAIMKTTSLEEIEDLFYDMSHIKVIPLLQHFLFVEKHVV
jgi:hypothetical protein